MDGSNWNWLIFTYLNQNMIKHSCAIVSENILSKQFSRTKEIFAIFDTFFERILKEPQNKISVCEGLGVPLIFSEFWGYERLRGPFWWLSIRTMGVWGIIRLYITVLPAKLSQFMFTLSFLNKIIPFYIRWSTDKLRRWLYSTMKGNGAAKCFIKLFLSKVSIS